MWSVALASACWQFFVALGLCPPAKFLPHSLNSFSAVLSVKSHLKCLCTTAESCLLLAFLHWWFWKCLTSSLLLSLGNRRLTGLEVTLQSFSHIFQVTGLTFSPHKCKFIVCIHALTRDESLNRALLIPWKHSCKTNSRKPRSSERVPRTLTDGTLTEREQNGYGTGTEWIPNRYRTGTRTRVERLQNVFCQAFPVRFLLISTVSANG